MELYDFTKRNNAKKKALASEIKRLKSQVSRSKKELPHIEADIRKYQAELASMEKDLFSDRYRYIVKRFLKIERAGVMNKKSSW